MTIEVPLTACLTSMNRRLPGADTRRARLYRPTEGANRPNLSIERPSRVHGSWPGPHPHSKSKQRSIYEREGTMFKLDKKALIVLAGSLAVTASVSGRLSAATASSPATRGAVDQELPAATPAGQTTLYGHIESLVRNGS